MPFVITFVQIIVNIMESIKESLSVKDLVFLKEVSAPTITYGLWEN